MTSFTLEDLVLYLYKETSPMQTIAIEEALKTDWPLREKFTVLQTSAKRLDHITTSPRNEAIRKIFNYAREKSSEEVQ